MKFLLLLVVIVFAAWLFNTRRRAGSRKAEDKAASKPESKAAAPAAPAAMLACVHCGVHLPQPDVLFDVAGRAFCSEAHRLAGPR